jgi:diaminopimelate epimerase
MWRGSINAGSVNTGVPHVVALVEDIESVDVVKTGRLIRNHPDFSPEGTNANFVMVDRKGRDFHPHLRTGRGRRNPGLRDGQRGCGIDSCRKTKGAFTRYLDHTQRQQAHRSFPKKKDGYKHVFLEGDARVIYSGELWEEAWRM